MPIFETPQPIEVRVVLSLGDLRVEAGDRRDTEVEVRPSDPTKRDDVAAAERTVVDLTGDRLSVDAPRTWRRYTWINDGSVDVLIKVPTGSALDARTDLGALGVSGVLSDCRFRTGLGHIGVEHTGPAELRSGMGNIDVGTVDGPLTVSTGSGEIHVDRVTGVATVKNSNGDTEIGAALGGASIKSANGHISLGRADGAVTAKTALGRIELGAMREGALDAHTAAGDISIGIVSGTSAYLDVSTTYGHVDSELDATPGPPTDGPRAQIHARTSAGDIAVHRIRPEVVGEVGELRG
jgi:DUF4097 and DUF4098 domain-containing protein YvlB